MAWIGALALVTAGCAGEQGPPSTSDQGGIPPIPGGSTASADGDGSGNGETSPRLDVGGMASGQAGDEGGDCGAPPTSNATLRGTVYAPNLEIPISGAVVYVTDGDAEPVPDSVYCAECVEVACNEFFVLTNADGTFELPAAAGAGRTLVVQKGQFLHAVDIDIVEGDNVIAPEQSNLPGEWNPDAGMWIPRIAVVDTTYDNIFNILGKIGLGQVSGGGVLVDGSEQFELLSQAGGGALLDDLDAMRQYHIIFVPCMSQEGMGGLSQRRIDNIRQWVSEGGKWYVTDWANEYLYQSFPNYQQLYNQGLNPDLPLPYDTTGLVLDAELLAWLEALPAPLKDIGGGHPDLLSLPTVELVDNWSGIEQLPPVMVQNDDGEMVDVCHYSWVEGSCPQCNPSNELRPMTISAEYGCGRMMFSTYHTDENAHPGLTPQELILLYIILEIGVCHDTPPPPPPPPAG